MVMNKTSAKERFFQSCINGDLSKIKTYLFYNVSPFSQDKVKKIVFFYFIFIFKLLNHLFHFTFKYGNNALHLASMNNQPQVLEYLLQTVKTYESNFRNKLGRTALNIAAAQGAFECIDILLNNLHCDVNSTDKVYFSLL